MAAADKAYELLEPGLDRALRGQVEALLAAITGEKERADAAALAARDNRMLLDKLVNIRSTKTDDPDGTISDQNYSAAFRDAEIDVTVSSPADVGARIKSRPAAVAAALIAALDDWAAVRRSRRYDRPGALRLSEAAIAADPDAWRAGLRRALDLADRASRAKLLRDLAASTKLETAPAVDLVLLGTALTEVGESQTAKEVLFGGRRRFPEDLWLNYDLARLLELLSRGEEAARYYSVARALRPETAHDLAHLLEAKGETVEAIAVFRDLVRLRPDDGRHWGCYGQLLKERGDRSGSHEALEKAIAILRRALRLKPDNAQLHYLLGGDLQHQEKLNEAIAEYRETIRLNPNHVDAHNNLGNALRDRGKPAEGIAEYREAIRIKPLYSGPHLNLGNALFLEGMLAEGVAEYREAIRLRPGDAFSHNNLGRALQKQGKLKEAIAEFHEAIRLKPDYANPHLELGIILHDQGKLEQGITEFREAIRLRLIPPTPTTNSATYCKNRESSTRRSEHTATPFEKRRTRPAFTLDLVRFYVMSSMTMRGRLANSARRFASNPTMPSPTTTSETPCGPRKSRTKRSPRIMRRSASSQTTPAPMATSASPWLIWGRWTRRSPNTAMRFVSRLIMWNRTLTSP